MEERMERRKGSSSLAPVGLALPLLITSAIRDLIPLFLNQAIILVVLIFMEFVVTGVPIRIYLASLMSLVSLLSQTGQHLLIIQLTGWSSCVGKISTIPRSASTANSSRNLNLSRIIDFDNTDTAWRKYDSITARELFRQFSCSGKLYSSILNPLLQVGLYAPAEQCSAAATLGILYYTVLAHQNDFNLVWCRGTVKERIFQPWMDLLESKGCKFVGRRKLTDVIVDDDTNCLSDILCGRERYEADAVVFAVEISVLQELIRNSAALYTKEEFVKVLNLRSVDLLTVKLWFDRKVNIPTASNSCSALDNSFGWSFFNLNAIQDEYKDESVTVLQADFYHANELLPLNDEVIGEKVKSYLSTCIKDFENAIVVKKEIGKFPESLTHFFPGSYKYMMRGFTSFPNVFMAGDWIINRHGSWSQEKSYVTGLEAANRVVDFLEEGSFAKIVPVDEEEPHVEALRGLNRRIDEIRSQLPFNGFFL
ncbi:uncharacterized protein LOC103497350 isoform X2 [Cucumis melo]|uniref:Uncharacterized protein LOC103497350 isoform X2 n=1 Tax=Cucumis melo TaxID=3656 RepID=A0A1S3C661_CUCME|nr:uncharacterized protein LOC103497350 isoform X2 [Cucumis melo]